MQKSGVTLKLLWLEYCEKCRENGELPYQSAQFNKYYSDYAIKTNATMHLNHKHGETMQVDWAGDTAPVIDTVTGEIIPAYLFVASLPYQSFFETIKSAEKEITAELQLRSDQGFQYTSHGYFKLTQSYNIIPSMPSPVTPLDNACAENFFSKLKSDLLRRLNPESMEDARTLIDGYIHFCNFERIQLKAKLTPFEKRYRLYELTGF